MILWYVVLSYDFILLMFHTHIQVIAVNLSAGW